MMKSSNRCRSHLLEFWLIFLVACSIKLVYGWTLRPAERLGQTRCSSTSWPIRRPDWHSSQQPRTASTKLGVLETPLDMDQDLLTRSLSSPQNNTESLVTNAVAATLTSTMNTFDINFITSNNQMGTEAMITNNREDQEYQRGLLTIAFITLLFASNSPALHVALTATSGSMTTPPVLLINAAVSVVALSGLLLGGGSALEAHTPLPSALVKNQQQQQNQMTTSTSTNNSQDPDQLAWRAGLELGLWKFLGTTANMYGLSLTTADHGAFLIQLTTLIVPVVQGVTGVPIPRRIWVAVALALAGVFMFCQDGGGANPSTNSLLDESSIFMSTRLWGDLWCVVAAGFYATYDLRLFQWGKRVAPRHLITNKITTQAVLSVLLLMAVGWTDTVQFAQSLPGLDAGGGLLLAVIIWSGVAVNAVAPFLQVGGQQAIGPTRAQTLYASQPLWASLLSWAWFGETVGWTGLFGGTAFLGALFLAATAEPPNPDCGEDVCEV